MNGVREGWCEYTQSQTVPLTDLREAGDFKKGRGDFKREGVTLKG